MRNSSRNATFFLILLTLVLSVNAYALPTTFVQEGVLMDAQNRVLEGNHNIAIRFLDVDAGQVLFEELRANVPLVNGYYAIQVGSVVPLDWTRLRVTNCT